MRDNIVYDKSKVFALNIIRLYKDLTEVKKVYILSKQILRSGTSIGANIAESQNAQSTSDFVHKLNIALKEADETQYWLELLRMSNIIDDLQYQPLQEECRALAKLLTSIIKSKKDNQKADD